MSKKHECCIHRGVGLWGEIEGYCCKCEFGVTRGPSLHGNGWYCKNCKKEHPGSHALEGCPHAMKRWNAGFRTTK